MLWIQLGDNNTKYFHNVIKVRKNRNKIFKLRLAYNSIMKDDTTIKEIIIKYYKHLLGKDELPKSYINNNFIQKGHTLEKDSFSSLCLPIINEEIKKALQPMNPDKALVWKVSIEPSLDITGI